MCLQKRAKIIINMDGHEWEYKQEFIEGQNMSNEQYEANAIF